MNPMKIANIIPTIEAIKPPAIPGPNIRICKKGYYDIKKRKLIYT